MKQLKIGSRLPIFAYKHTENFIDVDEFDNIKTKNLIILGNLRTKVIEASGKIG